MTQAAARAVKPITLNVIKELAAPVARVYAAFTNPEQFAQWFGPQGVSVTKCAMDFRVGGAWDCSLKTPDGKAPHVTGIYQEIIADKRLAFTWAWDQEDGHRGHETVVEIDFFETPQGTRIELFQSSFQEEEFRNHHMQGWTGCFTCLEEYLVA